MVENLGVSNLLIVESDNDRLFINRLLREVNLSADIEVGTPICCIDDYECLDGLSSARLIQKLNDISIEIEKRGIERIGILVDADNKGIQDRLTLINQSLKKFDDAICINRVNHWFDSQVLDIKISCHILNVGGYGELETLLRTIKCGDSTFADCLAAWKECLQQNSKQLTEKEFDKFWVQIYQRYDSCSKNEKKQAGRKCDFKASLEKNIWNFSSSHLDELKEYLKSFVAV
ncbi:MAG: hypothetical protein D3906_09570 [Candidatus Electrothrix sp. AUS1_2]|nr:hypothetical protein [Candidatus Electrothrix sp. AUS1_2]